MVKEYTLLGVEEIYDKFDVFEISNLHPEFKIKADSLEEVLKIGRNILQKRINRQRFESGFVIDEDSMSGDYGMYYAKIIRVIDDNGHELYKEDPR
jgi:hypothetical protein